MENKKLSLFIITCAAIIFIVFFSTPVSSVSENNNNSFSFRFENCTLSDALREISKKSGIKILSKNTFKKEILRKSYVNKNIDSIINDLLRGENCAVVWNYSDGNLSSIGLYSADDVKGNSTRSAETSRPNRGNDRDSFSDDMNIDQLMKVRDNYLKNRENSSRNRPNRSFSTSGGPVENNIPGNTNTENRALYGTSQGSNLDNSNISNTSNESANTRRAIINKQSNEPDNEAEDVEAPSPHPSPEPPEQENGSGLERPPMPPGF